MRKLTKIVNRRRKNYKPTIAVIDTRTNKVMSVNATVFYINQEKQRKYEEWKKEREAEREARQFLMGFLEKEMPDFFKMLNVFGNLGSWMY